MSRRLVGLLEQREFLQTECDNAMVWYLAQIKAKIINNQTSWWNLVAYVEKVKADLAKIDYKIKKLEHASFHY